MKRVLVIGVCGAGKSTLAKALAARTGLPLFHLDQLFWKPGWIQSDNSEFRNKLEEVVCQDQWILDGNYSSSFDLRFPRADTIVYLDFPRHIAMYRAIKRVLQSHGKVRTDMTQGCRERFNWGFMKYIWNFHRNHRPRTEKALKEACEDKRVIRLNGPKAVSEFLRELPGP